MKFFRGNNYRYTYYKGMQFGPSLVNYKFNLSSILSLCFRVSGIILLISFCIMCYQQWAVGNDIFASCWYAMLISIFVKLFFVFIIFLFSYHIVYGIYHVFPVKFSFSIIDIIRSILSLLTMGVFILADVYILWATVEGLLSYEALKSAEVIFVESGIAYVLENDLPPGPSLALLEEVLVPDCIARLTGISFLDYPIRLQLEMYYDWERMLLTNGIK